MKQILLGSASPRRQFLLKEAGIDFRVLASQTPEIPLPQLKGAEIAASIAKEKANALIDKLGDNEILITADTIVWLEGKMFGKPIDDEDAFQMLKQLNGKEHQVYTGVSMTDKSVGHTFSIQSNVRFEELTDQQIRDYIRLYRPMDKAGAYGAQECLPEGMNPCSGAEKTFLKKIGKEELYKQTLSSENQKRTPIIKNIRGSYFNVMGLPLVELFSELENVFKQKL